jgi:hypothetical protein
MKPAEQQSRNINTGKLYVGLGSTLNHGKWASFSKNEILAEVAKPDGLVYFEVSSLKDATALTKKFIDEFNLGASNWTGGNIYDEHFNFQARISYNGRVWDNEDWRIAKEIAV